MKNFQDFKHAYTYDAKYGKRVAYFCMEYAIDQCLKTYSGGLGFLAGSHMRSAYALRQNLIGIGVLWKNGYYDQVRNSDQSMGVLFQEKLYSFLEDTQIKFEIQINQHPVMVKAWYLSPDVFGTAPMFFLSTDLPENDYLARSVSHNLYDSDKSAKIAAGILLGVGGAKLLDLMNYDADVYHLNEAHALPAAFYLYKKFDDLSEVRKRLVFTTHTPEEAGNEKTEIGLLDKMSFFDGLTLEKVREITQISGNVFDHSLAALRLARLANGVSKLHGEVSRKMWESKGNTCPIISITNAQNKDYWADRTLYALLKENDSVKLAQRKKILKQRFFDVVADQTGQLFDENVLTIVWTRRFAAYKRADLITRDKARFEKIINNKEKPIQIVWAGKPYPTNLSAISTFNSLVHMSKRYKNCAVLVGYELALSKAMKYGADIWLNTPRVSREASGTSGMTAAMNGAVNLSTQDGWIPEFGKDKVNSFLIPVSDTQKPIHEQDQEDAQNLLDILEKVVLPTYYDRPEKWGEIVQNSMRDVVPAFGSDRMASEYYEKLYNTAN